MKPSFAFLDKGYPRKEEFSRDVLYDQLGWSDLKALPSFKDTCAIRMSLALSAVGVPLTGWLKVKAGPLKGKNIEPSQAKLSWWLKGRWGQPEVFRTRMTPGGGSATEPASFHSGESKTRPRGTLTL